MSVVVMATGLSAAGLSVPVPPSTIPLPPGSALPLWDAPADVGQGEETYLYVESDVGDPVHGGPPETLTWDNANFFVHELGGALRIDAGFAPSVWSAEIGGIGSPVRPGSYVAEPAPLNDPANPLRTTLMITSPTGHCEGTSGQIVIDDAAYADGRLTHLRLRMEQRCEGRTEALRAKFVWTLASDPLEWQPPAGSVPTTGSYLYLESEPGDPAGGGTTSLYSPAITSIDVVSVGPRVNFEIFTPTKVWRGDFLAPGGSEAVAPGYFRPAGKYGESGSDQPQMFVRSNGVAQCSNVSGGFRVDDASYVEGRLDRLALRFVQFCNGVDVALRGAFRWDADEWNTWQPPAGAVPDEGSYAFFSVDPGYDAAGARSFLHTPADSSLGLVGEGRHLGIDLVGSKTWFADFQTPAGTDLAAGRYLPLSTFRRTAPWPQGSSFFIRGGGTKSCTHVRGKFWIDEISYTSKGVVDLLTIRFEQQCDTATPLLRGKIRFDRRDWPQPDQTRAMEWQPPSDAVPDKGTFLYLESDPGDPIGSGQRYVYTLSDAVFDVDDVAGRAEAVVRGDDRWSVRLALPSRYLAVHEGSFPNVVDIFDDVTKGGIGVTHVHGCGDYTGSFVIDDVKHSASGLIEELTARFEQRCLGNPAALRGKLRFDVSNEAVFPDPGPPPTWQPPTGSVPDQGSFFYLESDADDYVGRGGTYLYTPMNADIVVQEPFAGALRLLIRGNEDWGATFMLPDRYATVTTGYFPNLQGYPSHNPTEGGLSFSGEGRGCDETGWFSIDELTRTDAGTISSVVVRFEQHCDGAPAGLRGKLRLDGANASAS